ncbi:FAD-binding protein [Streptomyces sp. NPDC088789]|uniref:FAD-binding protein n=1 Tax=Streptomyces sp. NPDC088789 TaxID=3365899 RepID=UPI0037F19B93
MPADTLPAPGWRRPTAPAAARLIRPRSYEEAVAAVRDCDAHGTIPGVPGGPGGSLGDAARNAGGALLDLGALDRVHAIDAGAGTVLCDAGVSLHRLTEVLLPLGWCLPVTPGSPYVTVGGALATDLPGVNHPASGTFSRHVAAFELLTGDGGIRTVRPGTALFDATAGGLGLTGAVLTATIALRPVESPLMAVTTERVTGLDALLNRLPDGDHEYAVARLDLLARGASNARATLVRADHAPARAGKTSATRAWRDFSLSGVSRLSRARSTRLQPLPAFFTGPGDDTPHRAGLTGLTGLTSLTELTRLAGLTRLPGDLYARRGPVDGVLGGVLRDTVTDLLRDRLPDHDAGGVVRYRFLLGYGDEDTLRRIVRRVAERRCGSLPAVLTRFGEAGPGWLSFPAPGWALTLDLPAALPGLPGLLDALDEEVAVAGGRIWLAGDSRPRRDLLAAMYPRLADFRALRAELDPQAAFTSDLARRLHL